MCKKITISIVVYNDPFEEIQSLLNDIAKIGFEKQIFVINNGYFNYDDLNSKITQVINLKKNIGFGRAHNLAIKKSFDLKSDFHLILNPDIRIPDGTVQKLIEVCESNTNIGLIMPKVQYESGKNQFLIKRLPTSYELIEKRFLIKLFPLKSLQRIVDKIECRDLNLTKPILGPFLSGCFMLSRTSVLKDINGFDERFFLYMEDMDLSRRIRLNYMTVYYPYVSVIHQYRASSHKRFLPFWYHLVSYVKYYNKWGWFNDPLRVKFNNETYNIEL